MAATFFAYRALVVLSFAPSKKPAVSPQPPIAIITLVSLEKRPRIVEIGSKGVNCGGESELKRLEFAKAMIACVIPWV